VHSLPRHHQLTGATRQASAPFYVQTMSALSNYCTGCQKWKPQSDFLGVNRNKGASHDKLEMLKTCSGCRRKIRRNPSRHVTFTDVENAGSTVEVLHQMEADHDDSIAPSTTSISNPSCPSRPLAKRRRTSSNNLNTSVLAAASAHSLAPPAVVDPENITPKSEDDDEHQPESDETIRAEFSRFTHNINRLAGQLNKLQAELQDPELLDLQKRCRNDWAVEKMTGLLDVYLSLGCAKGRELAQALDGGY
jgi:hypothetical protein